MTTIPTDPTPTARTEGPPTPRPDPAEPSGTGRRRFAAPALGVLVVVFLGVSVPRYLSFDPGRSLVPIRTDYPPHYALLVGHILFGSVALVTGCVQVWPWFRARFPVAHRWTGRVYLFGGVFPAGLLVLGVAPVSSTGFASSVGNTALALLWLGTSVAGYRAARRRRWAEHRAWMLRSVALSLSIVANRVWLVVLLVVTPPLGGLYHADPQAMIIGAATASVWLSWVGNLLLVEWWVLPRRPRPRRSRRPPARPAGTPARAA